jgi:BASS family bile acid:Na+ symporter
LLTKIPNYFPWFVSIASLLALFNPKFFTWFSGSLITIGLGIIMLVMGLTLDLNHFKQILKHPYWILMGFILQFTIMPFLGWGLSIIFNLPPFFSLGLILVASCPGGTASNVIVYLSKSNLALSVAMTTLSTISAIIMTPLLISNLSGSEIEVDSIGLFLSTLKVVLIPVVTGVLLNRFFPNKTKKFIKVGPALAVILITLIVASIIGEGKEIILSSGLSLLFSIMTLHFLGFFLGYWISKIFFKNDFVAKTISVEVGMQNSGLGVVLSKENFVNPAIAIPSAISSLVHSLYGSIFVILFKNKV